MRRKNALLLILVAIILIGFTILSIVKENLTTVEEIIARTTKTASTEVINDESQNEVDGYTVLSSNNEQDDNTLVNDALLDNSITNETVDNSINEAIQNETINTVVDNNTANNVVDDVTVATVDNLVNDTINNVAKNTTNNIINNTTSNEVTVNNTVQEPNLAVASINMQAQTTNRVGSVNNSNTNTTVNQESLPAAGAKSFVIWILIILGIISVISNIKYNNIILK